MKKAVMIAALAAAASFAQGATLVQSYTDFSTLAETSTLLNGATVNTDGSLHVNENKDGTDNDSSKLTYTDRPTIDISDAKLSLAGGLTFSFTAKGFYVSHNVAIISVASSSHDFLAAVGSDTSGNANFFFDSSDTKVTDIGTQGSLGGGTDYAFFTFTSQLVDNQCIFTLYKDGNQIAQGYANNSNMTAEANKAIAEQEITRLTLGGWSGLSDGSVTAMDLSSLAIYDGAMTAAEVKSLYNASVPEPTTATLSLLALAGLAARRRRK